MKKVFFTLALAALSFSGVRAQTAEKEFQAGLFNHVAVGVSVGTDGIGIDAATTLNSYFQIRAGVNFLPGLNLNKELDISGIDYSSIPDEYQALIDRIPQKAEIKAEPKMTNFKVLLDFYPFKKSSFHLTGGFYAGNQDVIKAYTDNGELKAVTDYNNIALNNPQFNLPQLGLELGDYLLTPDENGNVNAEIRTNGFKPYLGIGFGRAVPKKRLGFRFDMGVQFWGTPKVYCNDIELKAEDLGGEEGDVLKYISKATVYPVISFRLCGRIF